MDSAILRHLIEALLERQPILGEDSTFLRRALVFGGVASIISPVHLESFFTRYGVVIATVLLRDATRCERVGMLVFSAESDCLYAAEMEAARPGAYLMISRILRRDFMSKFSVFLVLISELASADECSCFSRFVHVLILSVPVDDEILHNSVNLVKDAADQQSQRCSTAEAFRRMVPWRYLKADAQEDINLRCLLLRMGARSTATPGDLYGVASHSCLPTQQACVTNDFTTPVFSVLPPHSSCDGAVFKRTSPLLDPTAMASWRLPTRKGVLPVTGDRYLDFYPIRGQPLGRAILISYQKMAFESAPLKKMANSSKSPNREAMVVFDESRDMERCGSRSAELVAFHLGLYDSGLFPLVADGAGGHGVVTRDLLPLFCLSPDFLGRVVLLRGPGIAELDAGECSTIPLDVHAWWLHIAVSVVCRLQNYENDTHHQK
uniref:Uncharacterized protein n=1 Tax=Oryza nivara TaxID=4536 RepID=A0A0E0I4C5_ORYNI